MRIHRVARSVRLRRAIRIRVWTVASTRLSSLRDMTSKRPIRKMERAASWARRTSAGCPPDSTDSRKHEVVPAEFTKRLTATVVMISRRSRCPVMMSA